jgi:arginine utilization protein RocB
VTGGNEEQQVEQQWQTSEQLEQLLCELVAMDSVTETAGEAAFADELAAKLRRCPAFAACPERVAVSSIDENRGFVTALHHVADVTDTIVLLSHFDTVDVAEYGQLRALAFDPIALTAALHDHADTLDPAAAADLASGDWLFGRGTMDMKAGLALHMSLIERAATERWPINLLLLTVPDEEVNSAGMRAAVERLVTLRDEHTLEFVLLLNGEPSFPSAARPGDTAHHIYSGSIGKLLPSALCVGRETHAGTPLAGLGSSYMASFLTREMEHTDAFRETVHGETTPLPVTLDQHDLRSGYSTQTPSRTSVLFNVFVMEQSAAAVLDRFERIVIAVAERCTSAWHDTCARERVEPFGVVRTLRYEQLVAHAIEHLGEAAVEQRIALAVVAAGEDLRIQSMAAVDALMTACPELAPAIVALFAPPYYPAVNSSEVDLVRSCITRVQQVARDRWGTELHQTHFFNGISDSSYVGWHGSADGWSAYERNTPGFGASYRIPFEAMSQLDAPVLNVGPLGKDPHQRTERLHRASAFEQLPVLLAELVQHVIERRRIEPASA